MKRILLFLLVCAFCGCTADKKPRIPAPTYETAASSHFIKTNYEAVERLTATLNTPLDRKTPLVVATVVDIDELTESSRLGRAISEQLCSRLVTLGFPVVELKLRGNIFIKRSEGELLLSREVRDLVRNHRAQAVVVGTYAAARNFIYVNLKIVRVHDNVIIAVHDYVLPRNTEVDTMLKASAASRP